MLIFILGLIVWGFIVGGLARLALPGPDPMPFWLWLRQTACEQLVTLQRRHLGAACRSAGYVKSKRITPASTPARASISHTGGRPSAFRGG